MMRVTRVIILLTFVKKAILDSPVDPSGWGYRTGSEDYKSDINFVDPSGWNYDREAEDSTRNVPMVKDREEQIKQDYSMFEDNIGADVKSKIYSNEGNIIFMRRFIQLLLDSANLIDKDIKDHDAHGLVEINISAEQLKTLINFSNNAANVSVRELDDILTTSLKRKVISPIRFTEILGKYFLYIGQKEIWLSLFLVLVLLFVWNYCWKFETTVTSKVLSLVFILFAASCCQEYYRKFKVAEIQQSKILANYPSSCQTDGWFGWFLSPSEECEKYYKALAVDPIAEVSLPRVISGVISEFFTHPAGNIGDAVAAFCKPITRELPFYWSYMVLILCTIGVLLLSCFVFFMCIGGNLNISNWFGSVNVRKNQTSQLPSASPSAPPSASQRQENASTSKPIILEAVSQMSNLILMDANVLGTLLVTRAKTEVLTTSGVQELKPSKSDIPSVSSCDLSKMNKQTEGENNCQKCCNGKRRPSDVDRAENISIPSGSSSVPELLSTFEVIQLNVPSSDVSADIVLEEEKCNLEKKDNLGKQK